MEVHTLHLLTFQWPKQIINPTLTSKGAGSAGLLYYIAGRKKDSNSNPPYGIEHFHHPRKFSYTFLSQSLAQLHHRDSSCSDFFHGWLVFLCSRNSCNWNQSICSFLSFAEYVFNIHLCCCMYLFIDCIPRLTTVYPFCWWIVGNFWFCLLWVKLWWTFS